MVSKRDEEKDPRGILEDRRPAEPYVAPLEEKELASQLRMKFDFAYRHRLPWERQWEINWLYQKGEQPVRNITTGDVFRLPQEDNSRLISGNNLIRPTARSLLGKLTRNIPTWTVVPPTSDLSDIQGSLVADSLLYYLRRKNKLDKKYIKAYRNVNTFGIAYFKLSWDRTAGRDIATCQECGYRSAENWDDETHKDQPCPTCEEEIGGQHQAQVAQIQEQAGLEAQGLGVDPAELEIEYPPPPDIPKLGKEREGDMRVDALDPRETFIDPSAAEFEDAQWICHRVALPVSEIRRRFEYTGKGKYIDKQGGIHAEQYITLVRGTTTFRAGTRQLEDHAYLYEFHEKPTEQHPEGRIIWMSNDIILDQIDSPYFNDLGRFPLYLFYWERNAGELYGESWIEQAAPIQREYNILLTQMREHRELTNNQQYFVPHNAQIALDEFDTTAGRLILYNSMGEKPEARPLPPMADYVPNEVARMEGAIRTHASVTEQEAGVTEAEASGRLAAIIESEASQQVGPILKENSSEWIELGRGLLILAQKNYTDDRKWTITGSDRPRPLTHYFDEMNISEGWDIDVQEDDSLSKNSAVRLTQTSELANGPVTSQLFLDSKTGQFDAKKFIAKSGLRMPGMMTETKSADYAYAASIPVMVASGQPYTPRTYDDPETYSEALEDWLKTEGRNPNTPEQVRAKVEEYYTFYIQRTQAALMQQQTLMAGNPIGNGGSPPGGTPPGSSAPPPPPGGGPSPGAAPPSSKPPSAVPESSAMVKQSDKAGEAASRTTANHEG